MLDTELVFRVHIYSYLYMQQIFVHVCITINNEKEVINWKVNREK